MTPEAAIPTSALAVATALVASATFALVRVGGRRLMGRVGERKVSRDLDRAGLAHLDDAYLPTRSGVTQVDHMVLAGGCIVVVETKNIRGLVDGRPDMRRWSVSAGGRGHAFQNPVDQNDGHLRAVRAIVGASVAVEGRVAFVGRARFSGPVPAYVVTRKGLLDDLAAIARLHPASRDADLAWALLGTTVRTMDRGVSRMGHARSLGLARGRRRRLTARATRPLRVP